MTLPIDFTSKKFKRQVALAQARGEPIEPLIRRLVLETIEQVQAERGGIPGPVGSPRLIASHQIDRLLPRG